MDSKARLGVLDSGVFRRSNIQKLEVNNRSRRNLFGTPMSPDRIAAQKHLSRVYARVAEATMSSINSISLSTLQPSQCVNFEGGSRPTDSRLQRTNQTDLEGLHSARKSQTSSNQILNANGPSGPAPKPFEAQKRNQKNHPGDPARFLNDGQAVKAVHPLEHNKLQQQ